MGSTYRLHRLILSRSSYFRNMLHGPWKEAGAPTVVLHIDDLNVNSEAIAMALAYLYGFHPQLNDKNAFRVLAAASFLDLQDLCASCTDFIISELRALNFYSYQVFAESQDYGIHGERVRNACWGYLCRSATMELREVLPKLSSQTLHTLLTSDELWVPNEEKRFELAFYTLLAKDAAAKEEIAAEERSNSEVDSIMLETIWLSLQIAQWTSTQLVLAPNQYGVVLKLRE
ncbi:Germ cell-less protein-like 1 [Ananas comosus]|uniref:Germ cell-less protein-like 1 n=1 Tax=Ananas comosus TaxID=4615 RepID=A0A199UWI5_ANACO|nr:Germ cell-less protein-like 1 [Ananas comosus]